MVLMLLVERGRVKGREKGGGFMSNIVYLSLTRHASKCSRVHITFPQKNLSYVCITSLSISRAIPVTGPDERPTPPLRTFFLRATFADRSEPNG